MDIYSDLKNKYQILDYHITHSRLLLRAMKNSERNFNIDILFQPVDIIFLPTTFDGIEISICEIREVSRELLDKYNFTTENNSKIFVLKDSRNRSYYVNATVLNVFHNYLDPNDSSIKGLSGEFGELILSYK